MPQMNPANWLLLLLFFNLIFIVIATKLHFFTCFSLSSMKDEKQLTGHALLCKL